MRKPSGEYAHTGWKKGLRERRRIQGHRRRFRLHVMLSAQLQLALMRTVVAKRLSKSMIVELALWKYLSRLAAYDATKLIQRLKYANALVSQLITIIMALENDAKQTNAHIPDRATREQRRIQLSQKANDAFDEIYNLAQTPALANASQHRATTYRLAAQLATLNASILEDASGEEILAEIEKLRKKQLAFEDENRLLEAEVKEIEQNSNTQPGLS